MPEADDLHGIRDEDLMRRCQGGDEGSFDEIFRRYRAPAVALLTRLVNDEAAGHELAQEAFLRIFRESASYEYPRRFSTWFYAIVRNLARNELRYRRRHPAVSLEETRTAPDGRPVVLARELQAPRTRPPEESFLDNEMFGELRDALGKLPEDERECLVLHRFAGLRYAEIAEIAGSTPTRVRTLVHAALERLREDLADFETRVMRLG